MSELKRIGITQRVVYMEQIDERRDALDQRWHDFAGVVGLQLVPIPNNIPDSARYAESMELEGLIFSGGNNIGINGGTYLKDKNLQEHDVALARDRTESNLLKWAMSRNKPLIGVCRGLQFINAFFGGNQSRIDADTHVAKEHMVQSRSAEWEAIYGESFQVNSYHRWGIPVDMVGRSLTITAVFDNHVEAVQHAGYALYGMMWHPERYQKFRNSDINFYKEKLGVL
ncbi:gamma-glutamyl-gamma-aminobutyrate hydrolase family protein [Aliifodinibius sp. S!AR15-10]|uniref:gamma-glutamyl-gamma-aminobutyrate hydrolase family protein n=1 Tax=Aliifodinibius sp. S!AR15-10 TaxID=2950437 RepID=UPI00285D6D64|nr:gamma-glutamyl-gamma-aminobutyrate hydrolase family protein [Aliifodinibius sp. S!AR15-10]MDR8393039.1 gamma-glutamyl-gamma-aminobutyrate hydrolase family protein [Aliifodinibius sp. S!AR15-10]